MNADPTNIQLPPDAALPDHLRRAVADFHTLRAKWADAQAEAAKVWADTALDQAKTADQQAAVEAARAGRDPAEVGTPAQQKLHAERDATRRVVAAYEQALADCWNTDVAPALRQAAEAEVERWRAERDTRTAACTEAITTLRHAEQRWYRACEAVSYWTRVADGDLSDFGGLRIPTRGVQQPDGIAAHLVGLDKGLALVPALQDGPAHRDEPADGEPFDKPRPKHPRKTLPPAVVRVR